MVLEKLAMMKKKFDLIFMDPPYRENLIEQTLNCIVKNDIIKDGGIIIAERDVNDVVPESVGNLKLERNQKYGNTILSFFKLVQPV